MKNKKVRLRWNRLIEARLVIAFILILLPTIIWTLMKQVHSPWWLENLASTPFSLVAIYLVIMLAFISFLSIQQAIIYFTINFFLALYLNNTVIFNNQDCADPVSIFQFNIKYQEGGNQLTPLIEHLINERYDLIALQGVSQRSKRQLIEKLSPYFPYFISGGSAEKDVISDQLLFSRYAFANISYVKDGQHAFLITSQWQLPFDEINLYSLHPPSPRNEELWQTRNKTLYQLKYALNNLPLDTLSEEKASVKKSLVIGDLNLSKHSKRMNILKEGMHSRSVNSWPNKPYIPMLFGLAIDQLWLSNSASICARQRINQFTWSDHYAIKTQLNLKK